MSLSKVLGQFQQLGSREFGTLGHPDGTLEVAGRPGWYYVTLPKGSTGDVDVGQFPGSPGLAKGATIAVVRDPYTGQRVISQSGGGGASVVGGVIPSPGSSVGLHAPTHLRDATDPVFIYYDQTLDFRTVPSTATPLSVYVYGGNVAVSGAKITAVGQTIDLTSLKPGSATDARYILIYLDAAGTAHAATGGTVRANRGLLVLATDCPALPANCFASAAVILSADVAILSDTLPRRDIVDLRYPSPLQLPTYARGAIIRGGATNWEAYNLAGSAGSFLRRDAADVLWSTLTLPNAAAVGDILYASGANAIGNLVDVAAGQPLLSGGVGVAPAYAGWTLVGTAGQTYTFGTTGGTIPTAAGTLSVSTTNNISAAGVITHAITSSSNPGAAASLLASDASGQLTLVNLHLGASSNQIVMQSAGVTGTLTWTPTTLAKVVTFPDATGTAVLRSGAGNAYELAIWYSPNGIQALGGSGVTNNVLVSQGAGATPAWSGFLFTGTLGGTTNFAVTSGKTLTLTTTDNSGVTFTGASVLTVPATGTAALLEQPNVFTNIAPLQTAAESWIGPSSTTGFYFKGGFIGIGNTNPQTSLDISRATGAAISPFVVLRYSDATGAGAQISFYDTTIAEVGRIESTFDVAGKTSLRLYTYDSGLLERLRINTTGDISVGTGATYGNFSVTATRTTINRHAFEDRATLNTTDTALGYASFDSIPTLNNDSAQDHFVSFQARVTYTSAQNLTGHMAGMDVAMTHSGAGTVTNVMGIQIVDVANTGPVTNSYGILIGDITRGGTTNYAIKTGAGAISFGGGVNIGGNYSAASTNSLQIEADAQTTINLITYSNTNNPLIQGKRARGSHSSFSAVQSGDNLLLVGGQGAYDASNFSVNKARMGFYAGENWDSTHQGTYISFDVTTVGGTTRAEAFRVMGGGISTNAGTDYWTLLGYTASAPAATGYVSITINGTTYKLLAST